MPVMRLGPRRDASDRAALEAVRGMLEGVAGAADIVAHVERKLAATRGWGFVMVDPVAYAEVIQHLTDHSKRPLKAVNLFTRLFSYLPPDGNGVLADRDELARVVGCTPTHVSELMGELEAVGAVYRRRAGRGGASPVAAGVVVLVLPSPRSAPPPPPPPPAPPPCAPPRRSSCGWL